MLCLPALKFFLNFFCLLQVVSKGRQCIPGKLCGVDVPSQVCTRVLLFVRRSWFLPSSFRTGWLTGLYTHCRQLKRHKII